MSDVADRVKKIVVEHLGVEEDKVVENASFIDDLGADSLDTVELVMAFEEEFGAEIPDEDAEKLKEQLSEAGAEVVGIHAHSGSGILDPDNWRSVAVKLVQVAQKFPAVQSIDIGGGLGVPDKPGDAVFHLV